MSSAIEEVLFLLDEASAEILVEPTKAVEPGEDVFGEISDEAKAIYKAALGANQEVSRITKEGDSLAELYESSAVNHPDLDDLDLALNIAIVELNVFINLLFLQTFEEYPKARHCGVVALRRGWILVGKPTSKESSQRSIAFELSMVRNPKFQSAVKA